MTRGLVFVIAFPYMFQSIPLFTVFLFYFISPQVSRGLILFLYLLFLLKEKVTKSFPNAFGTQQFLQASAQQSVLTGNILFLYSQCFSLMVPHYWFPAD
jgi:hypothetical protein